MRPQVDSESEAVSIFLAAVRAAGNAPVVVSCAREFALLRQRDTMNPAEEAFRRCRWQPETQADPPVGS